MKNEEKKNYELNKKIAYQQLQCVDWLTIIAKLSGIEISSKPIRDMDKQYFKGDCEDVDYKEITSQLQATQKSILQKIPNDEGLCAINPTCIHREEFFHLDDGIYKAVVDGYQVGKLERIEEDDGNLTYTNSYISNGFIKILFKEDGQVEKIEVKEQGTIEKDFNKIRFLSKKIIGKDYKESKIKHVSSNSYIEDKSVVVREDVYNYKLNSLVQQISLKKDSKNIDIKTRILIKDNRSKIQLEFDSDKGFVSVADAWPGYEDLFVGKNKDLELSIFSINSKLIGNKVVLETDGKGKYSWDFTVHVNEVGWQDSDIAEMYQSRSMPMIVSNMTPKIRPIIELDNLGVLVTKLRLSSNGKYILVTLKEMYNQSCDCGVKAGFRSKGVFEIDNDHNMIAITNSTLKFKPNQEFNIAFEL